jgi:hypothetical protein
MPNPPLAVWIPILMNVVALLQCVLAAKNAKGAKELGVGFAPSVYTLSPRSRISDRLQAQLYGMISLLPGIELRGDGGTNGSL